MNTVVRRTYTILGAATAVVFGSACGANPFDSDTASSSVRFALAGARTSAGAFLCSEADLAQLNTSPAGKDTRSDSHAVQGDCTPSFSVTVPKGNVSFVGELSGRGRPLMRGSRLDFPAKDDGFVVTINLEEIPALGLRTETIGLGGPDFYEYEVGETGGTRVPIGKNATDSVAALAAGERTVTLYGACGVQGGAVHDVMIPVEEAQRDSTVFVIDCNQAGSVKVVVTTAGGRGPASYMVDVGNNPMNNIGRNDSITVSGVTPGDVLAMLDTKDVRCTPNPVEQTSFLPSGGSLRVEFLVLCEVIGSTGSIRVITVPVDPPIGLTPNATFTATVTDADGFQQTATLGPPANDNKLFTQLSTAGSATVTLTQIGVCPVQAPGTQTVAVPLVGVRDVIFNVEC